MLDVRTLKPLARVTRNGQDYGRNRDTSFPGNKNSQNPPAPLYVSAHVPVTQKWLMAAVVYCVPFK